MSNLKINIVFVLPSLVAGGAERVMSLVAKNLNHDDFKVTLVVIGFEKDKAYNVDGLDVLYLNENRVSSGFFKLFKSIRKLKPEIVISCMSHLNIIMALILLVFPKIKLVTREANIKKITAIYYESKRSFISAVLLKISHKRTNAIICQSMDMADEMDSEYNISRSKLHIINNPISDEFKLKPTSESNAIIQYITVGRLHPEKGHQRILTVLSKLDYKFHYTIIGTGESLEQIESQIQTLGLEQQITFISYTNEVKKYLQQSDVFLQGSFAEGFPNSLLESCAVGTPVVAFDAPGGTREIVEQGVNGFLSQNEDEYLKHIVILKNRPLNPKHVSKSVFDKFNKTYIITQYQDLFKKVLERAS